ncbi:S-Ena type endospore appendage [Pontibacillus sp. HMF3514]|uniref:S-Ena type endospore appendage n=1 Tax=Pontibacillus sp. HMF3514 TaxID=2692425 RepID=UPI00131F90A3|nr:S-Ena type endospore appendage [Pontibacillus sp. HMF3514]QHE51634.1 hypothetical protein GS400_06100 [Pontibacillus sp. HMF3514]
MGQCCKKQVMSCSNKTLETDQFEHCYTFDCGTTENSLWTANGIVNPCGSFVLSVDRTCSTVDVLVNGGEVKSDLTEGQSVIITSDPLESVEINCNGDTGNNCKVSLCLTVNYECC